MTYCLTAPQPLCIYLSYGCYFLWDAYLGSWENLGKLLLLSRAFVLFHFWFLHFLSQTLDKQIFVLIISTRKKTLRLYKYFKLDKALDMTYYILSRNKT